MESGAQPNVDPPLFALRPDLVGSRYRLDDPLGEGQFAVTYLGRDLLLDRPVAIKLLRPEHAADRAALIRFDREARAAAAVDHPNVVRVYDDGAYEDRFYLVMQYVSGRTLRQVLDERNPPEPAAAVGLARLILAGLGAVHAAGIVHRDVKPENVLVGDDGGVRLTDFGLARGAADGTLTGYGAVVGTAAYMAPEQARGDPVGPGADLYAVGAVLFELLTGRPPFVADHPIAVLFAHLQEAPPPPSSLAEGIPTALDAAVLRALAKDPADRYANAAEMAHALGDALTPRPPAPLTDHTVAVPAASPAEGDAAVHPSDADAPTLVHVAVGASPEEESPRSRFRRRAATVLAAALLGLALVATVAGVAALVTRGGGGGNDNGDPAGGRDAPGTRPVAVAGEVATPEPAPPTATARPTASPTSTVSPTATSTPRPSATASPTEMPRPTRTPRPTETPAPTPLPPLTLAFGAADWGGGYYRGDGEWYGRTWTAIYGAQSRYPAATLTFELAAAPADAPADAATLTIVGLDDEFGGTNPIVITVNGVEIYSGAAPFASWDGNIANRGADAAWTPVAFSVPAGALRAGTNEITVANLSPSANFGLPPYVLLSHAALEVEGG